MPNLKNFSVSTVATPPSPDTSGTSLVVQAGDGAKFPITPFEATIWPPGQQPLVSNAEIVTVTGISTDTFTIVRTSEEPSVAQPIAVGWNIAATLTNLVLSQLNNGWNFILPTLTYISSNQATFPDPSGIIAANISIGDKLWWIQSSTNYYNYVLAVSNSTGVTTLTIVNSAYLVTSTDSQFQDASITSAFISKVTNPVGFPPGFFVPGPAGPTTGSQKIYMSGSEVRLIGTVLYIESSTGEVIHNMVLFPITLSYVTPSALLEFDPTEIGISNLGISFSTGQTVAAGDTWQIGYSMTSLSTTQDVSTHFIIIGNV